MREHLMRGVVGMAAVMALAACGGGNKNSATSDSLADTTATAAPKTVAVNVNIQCTSPDTTYIKITPWAARLKKNNKDDLEFVVSDSTNADAVEVVRKTATADWPLAEDPPYTLRKGNNGKKGLKGAASRGEYAYNIVATCTVNGTPRKLIIDPDIFVD